MTLGQLSFLLPWVLFSILYWWELEMNGCNPSNQGGRGGVFTCEGSLVVFRPFHVTEVPLQAKEEGREILYYIVVIWCSFVIRKLAGSSLVFSRATPFCICHAALGSEFAFVYTQLSSQYHSLVTVPWLNPNDSAPVLQPASVPEQTVVFTDSIWKSLDICIYLSSR